MTRYFFRPRRSLKTTALLFLTSTLLACSKNSTFYQSTQTLKDTLLGSEKVLYSEQGVRDLPYSAISVRIGKSPAVLLILAQVKGDTKYWYASDRGMLATRHGRIVKTGRFPADLLASKAVNKDPLIDLQTDGRAVSAEHKRLQDYAVHEAFGYPITLSLDKQVESETVSIMGTPVDTLKFSESLSSSLLHWSAKNTYWINSNTYALVKTTQHIAPRQPSITIEFLK